MQQSLTPAGLYQQRLADQQIQPDRQQQQVVDALQRRHDSLLQSAAAGGALQRWWHKLTQRHTAVAVSAETESGGSQRGLYLWGGVGRGKTWLMDLFFDCLPAGMGKRMHYHHFMNQVNQRLQALGAGRDPLPQVADELLGTASVLCLDEFFVNDIGNAMLLGGILQRLFEREVMLVTTSNVPPSQLYQDGLQRARFLPSIALLQQHCEVLELTGERDYRLRQLQQMPLYLYPDTAANRVQMQQRFCSMAAGQVRESVVLQINRRPLATVFCAHSEVWIEFATLCREPRSSRDYLELAAEFSSVFVSGLPVMDDDEVDVVRRFIDLVDAFYDQKVKLVMTAAAAMDAIYTGRRLAFEFRRTRSRLQEMQSSEYLAAAHQPV
ncbi:MAG: AFG1 family ATPase [Gammaproteobacteria bacterium]|nr:AFG1 family ATPase [Gammaproteobacteria bacterium]